jgi:hypothetical protein
MHQDWLVKNAWSLIIAIVTLVSTYAIYGYRVGELEAQAQEIDLKLVAIQKLSEDVAVMNAHIINISSDVDEIKVDVKELTKQ